MIKQDRRTRTLLHTKTQDEFGTWGIPGRKPQIVYGTAVMSALAGEAMSAGRKPIGGVLFGTSSEADTRILAYRAIDCQDEDKGGAPFSEAGEAALGRLAEAYSEDLSLTGMRPVGWYRSCWESGIQLNQDDLRVWNRFFPLPSQISLVLRVQENAPVRAGFFFRPHHGGPVRIDSSYRTFEIHGAPDAAEDFGRLAEAVEVGARTSLPPPPELDESMETRQAMEPPGELFTPPAPPDEGRRMVWGAAALVCLAAVVGWLWFGQSGTTARQASDIVLRFRGTPQQLALVWDPRSPQFEQADSAELRLIDGKSDSTITLAASALRLGQLPVPNRSGLIEAQMSIHLAGTGPREDVMAAANFVGPSGADATPAGGGGFGALRTEWAALDAQMRERVQTRTILEARVRELRQKGKQPQSPAPELSKQPAPVAAQTPPPPAVVKPLSPAVPKSEPAAPVASERPPAPTPPGSAAPVFGSDRAPSRAPVGLPEPPAAPAYTGPASGKFIWTGYLGPGKTVTIDGRRATTGSVNGSLPGVPVRISVYPGEFSSAGLSVFSASARHQAGPVTENRSAQNGWLNTRYVYDPARARDATVSSAPSEAGGFKQLQIASGERPVSVVVVEWSVVR